MSYHKFYRRCVYLITQIWIEIQMSVLKGFISYKLDIFKRSVRLIFKD